METGLIAVRIYDDGRHEKAVAIVWEKLFGVKDAIVPGDVFERDGVKWFTPGNGCQSFTPDIRAKMLDEFRTLDVEAEDWTASGEWRPGDDYRKNDEALKAVGLEPKGEVVAAKSKDGKVTTEVVMTASTTK